MKQKKKQIETPPFALPHSRAYEDRMHDALLDIQRTSLVNATMSLLSLSSRRWTTTTSSTNRSATATATAKLVTLAAAPDGGFPKAYRTQESQRCSMSKRLKATMAAAVAAVVGAPSTSNVVAVHRRRLACRAGLSSDADWPAAHCHVSVRMTCYFPTRIRRKFDVSSNRHPSSRK